MFIFLHMDVIVFNVGLKSRSVLESIRSARSKRIIHSSEIKENKGEFQFSKNAD